jgi:zinc transport system substrate-binding protein
MKRLLLLSLISLTLNTKSWAAPEVVVSIKPVHSIVAALMDGVGKPKLLLQGNESPHDFSMRPSQAKSIQDADLVIWIGENLEGFLTKPVSNLSQGAVSMEIMELAGIKKLEYRDHDEHDHASHKKGHDDDHKDEHKHDEDKHDHDEHKDEQDHETHSEDKHDHEEHKEEEAHAGHDHGSDGIDPHVWLNTDNMKIAAQEIAKKLKELDPDNASSYDKNAKTINASLESLEVEIKGVTASIKNKEYVVFHDAYQYFENQFGLQKPITITLNPEVPPGAARIKEIREEVQEHSISCLFSEPQFSSKVLEVVSENTGKKIATIDPIGSALDAGKDHYSKTLLQLANRLSDCLSG